MAEKQYVIETNGTAVYQDDLNLLGESAGLADDRVFAEFFRMSPTGLGTSNEKGILPTGYRQGGDTATIVPGAANGSVSIRPFRAIVGPDSAASDDAEKWRGMRSGMYLGSSSPDASTTSISANVSGDPRWDLVYAVLTPAAEVTETRRIKDPTTKVIAATSVTIYTHATVTIGVVVGTPHSTAPDLPTLPSDAAGAYYIPLAYIRVPNGHGSGSTIPEAAIYEVMPVVRPHRSSGASSLSVATESNKAAGSALTTARIRLWGAGGTRPEYYVPPSMGGSDSLFVALDMDALSSTSWSHQDDGIVDSSRDWRNRIFKVTVVAGQGNFCWTQTTGTDLTQVPSPAPLAAAAAACHEIGQSFTGVNPVTVADDGTRRHIMVVDPTKLTAMAATSVVTLYVNGSTGALHMKNYTAVPTCRFMIWIDATGPFANK